MHLFYPYRNYIGTYCVQRRHQSWLRKNKNHPQLKTSSEPKTSQSVIRAYGVLQKIHSSLFRYDILLGITIKIWSGVRMDWRMWCILRHSKEETSRSTYSQVSKLVSQVSRTCWLIRHSHRWNLNTNKRRWDGLQNYV